MTASLPRNTRQIGAFIEKEFGIVHEGRSGLIALLHRLGLEDHKPEVIPRRLDEAKQKAFRSRKPSIEGYDLNSLGDDETVLFADAVHPTHAARTVGAGRPRNRRWGLSRRAGASASTFMARLAWRADRHGGLEVETVDASSTISLLAAIDTLYPMLALIHVFLDDARYHHARLVQEWLAQPGRPIQLHFIPPRLRQAAD